MRDRGTWSALPSFVRLGIIVAIGCSRASRPSEPSVEPARAPAARPSCGERAGEPAWAPFPRAHPAYAAVRAFADAFGARDVAKLAAASGLPLRVRYPKSYGDDGRRVVWDLDERATSPAARERALRLLVTRFDDEPDAARELGTSTFIDMSPASTDSELRVRLCVDYARAGDGVFDELELALTRGSSGAYVVREAQIGWFELR